MKNISEVAYDDFIGDFENLLKKGSGGNDPVVVRSEDPNESFLIMGIDKAKEVIRPEKLDESNIEL